MNRRQSLSLLIFFLTLAPMARSHAQALKTQDWANWNATFQAVFPQESWLRYETAEDAQRRIEFELDATGRAAAIRIWFKPDEPYEMRRVGDDSLEK